MLVKDWLGHKRIDNTLIYAQLAELKTLYGKQVSVASLARIFDVSRPRLYKRLKELGVLEVEGQ